MVGSKIVTAAVNAALANGMLAHADETDDSHAPSQTHPGCGIVPAALAMAERERRNTWSLVYAHRRGLGRALYVGATLADAREGEAPRDERRELFVKASWAL